MTGAWIAVIGTIAGSLLGGVVTIVVTLNQNRHQRQTAEDQRRADDEQQREDRKWQMLQARHDERKSAYVEFLQALRAVKGTVDSYNPNSRNRTFGPIGKAVHDKLAVVRLVGAVSVTEQAAGALHAVAEYHSTAALSMEPMKGSELAEYPTRLERAKDVADSEIRDLERKFRNDLIDPDIGIEPKWSEQLSRWRRGFGQVGSDTVVANPSGQAN